MLYGLNDETTTVFSESTNNENEPQTTELSTLEEGTLTTFLKDTTHNPELATSSENSQTNEVISVLLELKDETTTAFPKTTRNNKETLNMVSETFSEFLLDNAEISITPLEALISDETENASEAFSPFEEELTTEPLLTNTFPHLSKFINSTVTDMKSSFVPYGQGNIAGLSFLDLTNTSSTAPILTTHNPNDILFLTLPELTTEFMELTTPPVRPEDTTLEELSLPPTDPNDFLLFGLKEETVIHAKESFSTTEQNKNLLESTSLAPITESFIASTDTTLPNILKHTTQKESLISDDSDNFLLFGLKEDTVEKTTSNKISTAKQPNDFMLLTLFKPETTSYKNTASHQFSSTSYKPKDFLLLSLFESSTADTIVTSTELISSIRKDSEEESLSTLVESTLLTNDFILTTELSESTVQEITIEASPPTVYADATSLSLQTNEEERLLESITVEDLLTETSSVEEILSDITLIQETPVKTITAEQLVKTIPFEESLLETTIDVGKSILKTSVIEETTLILEELKTLSETVSLQETTSEANLVEINLSTIFEEELLQSSSTETLFFNISEESTMFEEHLSRVTTESTTILLETLETNVEEQLTETIETPENGFSTFYTELTTNTPNINIKEKLYENEFIEKTTLKVTFFEQSTTIPTETATTLLETSVETQSSETITIEESLLETTSHVETPGGNSLSTVLIGAPVDEQLTEITLLLETKTNTGVIETSVTETAAVDATSFENNFSTFQPERTTVFSEQVSETTPVEEETTTSEDHYHADLTSNLLETTVEETLLETTPIKGVAPETLEATTSIEETVTAVQTSVKEHLADTSTIKEFFNKTTMSEESASTLYTESIFETSIDPRLLQTPFIDETTSFETAIFEDGLSTFQADVTTALLYTTNEESSETVLTEEQLLETVSFNENVTSFQTETDVDLVKVSVNEYSTESRETIETSFQIAITTILSETNTNEQLLSSTSFVDTSLVEVFTSTTSETFSTVLIETSDEQQPLQTEPVAVLTETPVLETTTFEGTTTLLKNNIQEETSKTMSTLQSEGTTILSTLKEQLLETTFLKKQTREPILQTGTIIEELTDISVDKSTAHDETISIFQSEVTKILLETKTDGQILETVSNQELLPKNLFKETTLSKERFSTLVTEMTTIENQSLEILNNEETIKQNTQVESTTIQLETIVEEQTPQPIPTEELLTEMFDKETTLSKEIFSTLQTELTTVKFQPPELVNIEETTKQNTQVEGTTILLTTTIEEQTLQYIPTEKLLTETPNEETSSFNQIVSTIQPTITTVLLKTTVEELLLQSDETATFEENVQLAVSTTLLNNGVDDQTLIEESLTEASVKKTTANEESFSTFEAEITTVLETTAENQPPQSVTVERTTIRRTNVKTNSYQEVPAESFDKETILFEQTTSSLETTPEEQLLHNDETPLSKENFLTSQLEISTILSHTTVEDQTLKTIFNEESLLESVTEETTSNKKSFSTFETETTTELPKTTAENQSLEIVTVEETTITEESSQLEYTTTSLEMTVEEQTLQPVPTEEFLTETFNKETTFSKPTFQTDITTASLETTLEEQLLQSFDTTSEENFITSELEVSTILLETSVGEQTSETISINLSEAFNEDGVTTITTLKEELLQEHFFVEETTTSESSSEAELTTILLETSTKELIPQTNYNAQTDVTKTTEKQLIETDTFDERLLETVSVKEITTSEERSLTSEEITTSMKTSVDQQLLVTKLITEPLTEVFAEENTSSEERVVSILETEEETSQVSVDEELLTEILDRTAITKIELKTTTKEQLLESEGQSTEINSGKESSLEEIPSTKKNFQIEVTSNLSNLIEEEQSTEPIEEVLKTTIEETTLLEALFSISLDTSTMSIQAKTDELFPENASNEKQLLQTTPLEIITIPREATTEQQSLEIFPTTSLTRTEEISQKTVLITQPQLETTSIEETTILELFNTFPVAEETLLFSSNEIVTEEVSETPPVEDASIQETSSLKLNVTVEKTSLESTFVEETTMIDLDLIKLPEATSVETSLEITSFEEEAASTSQETVNELQTITKEHLTDVFPIEKTPDYTTLKTLTAIAPIEETSVQTFEANEGTVETSANSISNYHTKNLIKTSVTLAPTDSAPTTLSEFLEIQSLTEATTVSTGHRTSHTSTQLSILTPKSTIPSTSTEVLNNHEETSSDNEDFLTLEKPISEKSTSTSFISSVDKTHGTTIEQETSALDLFVKEMKELINVTEPSKISPTEHHKSTVTSHTTGSLQRNNLVIDLRESLSKLELIDFDSYDCPVLKHIDHGITLENNSVPHVIRFINVAEFMRSKREIIQNYNIEKVLGEPLELRSKAHDVFAIPGTKIQIPCVYSPEIVENVFNYSWTFADKLLSTEGRVQDRNGILSVDNITPQDGGNYTCFVITSKEHTKSNIKYEHQVYIVSLPTYSFTTRILYNSTEQCKIEDTEILSLYFPSSLGGFICGSYFKVCKINVSEPQCVNKLNNYLMLNLSIVIEPLNSILLGINTSICDVSCEMKIYSRLVSFVLKNLETIEKIPVYVNLSYRHEILIPVNEAYFNESEIISTAEPPRLYIGCPSGFGYYSKTRLCEACKRNTYSKGDETQCLPCPAGQYQPLVGSKSCVVCSNPLQDPYCLRIVYSNTQKFRVLVGAIMVLISLIGILIIWCQCFKRNMNDIAYKNGAKKKKRNRVPDIEKQETEPLLSHNNKRQRNNKVPPEPPPPDFL
ncbi:hypothetical protein FQR65_LT08941 [Abscondita terminalis]|nr:hypothetical protein FQR65_LT08941 [Abscondita terminalis]